LIQVETIDRPEFEVLVGRGRDSYGRGTEPVEVETAIDRQPVGG
jgi:hypothetical protein